MPKTCKAKGEKKKKGGRKREIKEACTGVTKPTLKAEPDRGLKYEGPSK